MQEAVLVINLKSAHSGYFPFVLYLIQNSSHSIGSTGLKPASQGPAHTHNPQSPLPLSFRALVLIPLCPGLSTALDTQRASVTLQGESQGKGRPLPVSSS